MQNKLAADLDHILNHTRDLWEEMRGQNLFMTGGTGFFGCWLLESLTWINDRLSLGASVTVLTRDPEKFLRKAPHLGSHPMVHLLQGDVCAFEFPAGEFPYVIHAATEANARLNQESPLTMVNTILAGTRQTLEFARTHGTRKFLLTSSGAVYGKQPPEIPHIHEEYSGGPDPLDPGSAYGEGKRAAELLCAIYARQYGIEAKIARCFAFVGPYLPLDIHFAIGNFISDALKGGPIRVNGDGTPYRSYLYAADLAIWLWTLLFKAPSSRPYNVGAADDLSIETLAHVVQETLCPGAEIQIARQPKPGQLPSRYVPETRRAQQELGLQSWVSLSDAIQKTADWTKLKSYGK